MMVTPVRMSTYKSTNNIEDDKPKEFIPWNENFLEGPPISEEKKQKAINFLNKKYHNNQVEPHPQGYDINNFPNINYYFIDETNNSRNGLLKGKVIQSGPKGVNYIFEYYDTNGNIQKVKGFKPYSTKSWWRIGNPFGWGSALKQTFGGKYKKTHKKYKKSMKSKKSLKKGKKTRRQ